MLSNAVLLSADGPKPVPRSGFGPQRPIYLVGGGAGSPLSTTVSYNPRTTLWKQLAGMAVPRYGHGCVDLEGKLSPWVYDPTLNSWAGEIQRRADLLPHSVAVAL